MEKKVDRRVIKTRRQLKKGLAALMKEKSVNQITVKELVEEVDINRSTFYLHFKDIQDLLREIEENMEAQIKRAIEEHPIVSGNENAFYFIEDMFRVLDEEREISKALIGPNGDMGFIHRIERIIKENSRGTLEKIAKNKKAPARRKAEDDYLLTTKLFCGYCGAYLCGESGTSHTGNVHHYYKCVSVKKKRTECHKKSVRKEWIEDLVVSETMKMVMDDTAIEAIVSMLMDLQDRENVNLPLYEQQLREADTAIQNLLNAIQQGILTKSTKGRLEELEATKEELETKIACEKLAKPKVSAEFMTFWLHRFRKLDVRQKSHRKMLIDTFINAIFLYDDKMVITFNYNEGTTTITFDDLKTALADHKTGSDLDCSTAPRRSKVRFAPTSFLSEAKKTSSARSLVPPSQLRPAPLGSQLVGCLAGGIFSIKKYRF